MANTASSSGAKHIGDLSNKIALITGASSGLGRAIAEAYAAAGAFIVSADLTPDPPKTPMLAEVLKSADLTTPTVDLLNTSFPTGSDTPRAIFVKCNVTEAREVEAAVAAAVKQYGRLDVMVNNAGIAAESSVQASAENRANRTHELDESVFDLDMAINVKGVWLGCKYAAAQMLKQDAHPSGDRGWIINLCSVLGLVGSGGATPYCASKGAVLQMTRSVALEYATDRIHVNCINPGFVETGILEPLKARLGREKATSYLESLHPWGRLAMPQDIARMALFLAGEGAAFCTGAAYLVDGGYSAR